jgi:lipid-binding SYLF domain-containing protein
LSLEGQVIKDDGTANENLYGEKIEAKDILFAHTTVPKAGGALAATLTKYSPHGGEPFKK